MEEDKKWRRRSDERPAELSAAAFQLFTEQGFAKTRLEDVAKRAGVSKGTIYRYFANKEALFEAVVDDAVAPRFAEAQLLVDAYEGDSTELLRMFFKIARQALQGPFPPMIKLIIAESGNFPRLAELWVEHALSHIFALVARILQRGVDRGEFRAIDVPAVTPLVMAPVFTLAVWRQTFAKTGLEMHEQRTLDAHLDMLIRGLRSAAEAQDEGKGEP